MTNYGKIVGLSKGITVDVKTQKALVKSVQESKFVYIISAPSGTGKTTISRKLVAGIPALDLSISHTTREKRPQEKHGDHYWFVSKDSFANLVSSEGMLEWAKIFGNLYGTSYGELDRIISNNHKVLLEIDVQGWHIARKKLKSASSILIMPPTTKELWKRLDSRGTDTHDHKITRFNTARKELEYAKDFHHFVINNDLNEAYKEIHDFILHSVPMRLSRKEGLMHSKKLLNSFNKME